MDAKTVSLLKKHIRMIDYIRADLVAILSDKRIQNAEAIALPPKSELYAEFDAAITAGKVTTAEGEHVADCPCAGCRGRRDPSPFFVPVMETSALAMQRALDEIAALFPKQIDGPAMAWVSLSDEPEDGPYHVYETLAGYSEISEVDAIENWRRGVLAYLFGKFGAIYWRVRPEISSAYDQAKGITVYKVYSRLVVAPATFEQLAADIFNSPHADTLDVGDPEPFVEAPELHQPRPPTDYELKKQAIHEAHARGQMCMAGDLMPGIRCMCPKCLQARHAL